MENGTPEQPEKPKWYFTTTSLTVAFMVVGPLALPLLWANPRLSKTKKIIWTVISLALTWAMVVFTVEVGQKVLAQYRELGLIK